MAQMKRIDITVDEDTLKALAAWKRAKKLPSSQVIREAVKAYTHWKRAELQLKAEDFDGVDPDITYD